MSYGLLLAAVLTGQAASYGPAAPAPPPQKTVQAEKAPERKCAPSLPGADGEIVVCAVKPQGYRLDPDVMAAKKAVKDAQVGPPKRPENFKDNSCSVVGPAGCVFAAPAINLLAATLTVAEIADRIAKGQDVGSIFVTNPQMSEYEYYMLAKKVREAKELAAATKARAKVRAEAKAAAAKQQAAPAR